jgi:hypothetical protein
MRALLTITIILAGVALLTGCATMEDESDLPWNTPQSWEGSPSIPGLNQY